MIYLSKEQQQVLEIVDNMINKDKTFEDISNYLYSNGYCFRVETKNGYTSKTRFEICSTKDMKYTFVDLIKRRNCKAYWETYRIS